MSRTMIISSWPTSNTASTTASGSWWRPPNTSRYMSATRRGVSFSPSRPGSSPIPSRISRTPASTFWGSNSAESVTLVLLVPLAPAEHGDPGGALAPAFLGRPLLHPLQQPDQVLLLDRLPLDQRGGDLVELSPLALEDLQGLVVGLVDQPADLGVDLEGHLVGVVGVGGEVTAQEYLALALAQGERTEPVRHPVLGDHPPGHLGG